MADISAIWTSNGYDKMIPKGIQAEFMRDGKYYALPVNIHRNNNLYYNKALLAKAGIKAAPAPWPNSGLQQRSSKKQASPRWPSAARATGPSP